MDLDNGIEFFIVREEFQQDYLSNGVFCLKNGCVFVSILSLSTSSHTERSLNVETQLGSDISLKQSIRVHIKYKYWEFIFIFKPVETFTRQIA